MIEEAFARQDWDDTTAQQTRDQRAELLQSQGYHCTRLTLYRVNDGMPVYFLSAEKPEAIEPTSERPDRRSVSKSKARRQGTPKPKRVNQVEVR